MYTVKQIPRKSKVCISTGVINIKGKLVTTYIRDLSNLTCTMQLYMSVTIDPCIHVTACSALKSYTRIKQGPEMESQQDIWEIMQ